MDGLRPNGPLEDFGVRVDYDERVVALDDFPLRAPMDWLWNLHGEALSRVRLPSSHNHQIQSLRRMLAVLKIPHMLELVTSGPRTVVFSDFASVVGALRGVRGYDVVRGPADLLDKLNRLHAGHLDGIGISLVLGHTGLDLSSCERMIFVDANPNPRINMQAVGRCLTLRRSKPLKIERIVFDHPFDRAFSDRIPGGWSDASRRHYN